MKMITSDEHKDKGTIEIEAVARAMGNKENEGLTRRARTLAAR